MTFDKSDMEDQFLGARVGTVLPRLCCDVYDSSADLVKR